MHTSRSVQSSTASFTLEVFGFLMGDEDLEIVEVTLAVVTPWSADDLLYVRSTALLLAHFLMQL